VYQVSGQLMQRYGYVLTSHSAPAGYDDCIRFLSDGDMFKMERHFT